MATPNPKKAALQSAAADSYSKPGAEIAQVQPPLSKPNVSVSNPAKAGRALSKGQKSR